LGIVSHFTADYVTVFSVDGDVHAVADLDVELCGGQRLLLLGLGQERVCNSEAIVSQLGNGSIRRQQRAAFLGAAGRVRPHRL
jgi:hypothetical protein